MAALRCASFCAASNYLKDRTTCRNLHTRISLLHACDRTCGSSTSFVQRTLYHTHRIGVFFWSFCQTETMLQKFFPCSTCFVTQPTFYGLTAFVILVESQSFIVLKRAVAPVALIGVLILVPGSPMLNDSCTFRRSIITRSTKEMFLASMEARVSFQLRDPVKCFLRCLP